MSKVLSGGLVVGGEARGAQRQALEHGSALTKLSSVKSQTSCFCGAHQAAKSRLKGGCRMSGKTWGWGRSPADASLLHQPRLGTPQQGGASTAGLLLVKLS